MCRIAGCKGNVQTVFDPNVNYQVINRYSTESSHMLQVKGMVFQECESCNGRFPDTEVDLKIKTYVKNHPNLRGEVELKDLAEEMGIDLSMVKAKDNEKKSKSIEKPTLPPKVSGAQPAKLPSDLEAAFAKEE